MAQFARPISDITTGWATTPLWSKIDEVIPLDADWITGTGGSVTCEVKLSTVTDPLDDTNHNWSIRLQAGGSGGPERINAYLYEGTTLIEALIENGSVSRGSFTTYSGTLISASSISDYSDLRIRLTTGGNGGSETIDCSWVELSVPDYSAPTGFDQAHFRIRVPSPLNADVGWVAGEDVNVSMDAGILFSVRFKVERTSAGVPTQFKPKISFNDGAYTDCAIMLSAINAPCVFAKESPQYTDGDPTSTELLTPSITYLVGEGVEGAREFGNILTTALDINTDEGTEFEYTFQILNFFTDPVIDEMSAGDTIDVRLYESDDTPFTTYSETPRLTVTKANGYVGLTNIENPNRTVWYTSDDKFYIAGEDHNQIASSPNAVMMKSDDGFTWQEVDPTGKSSTTFDYEAGDMQVVGDIAYMMGIDDNDPFHFQFDFSQDIWVINSEEEIIKLGVTRDDQCGAIVRRPDGTMIAFWQELDTDTNIIYRIKDGTWSSDFDLDSEAGKDFTMVAVVAGATFTHVFYKNSLEGIIWHNTIAHSDDALGTREQVANNAGTAASSVFNVLPPVLYDPTGGVTERVVVAYQESPSDYLAVSKIDDNGSPSTPVVATDASAMYDEIGQNKPIASLCVSDQNLYLVYADDITQEIWLTISTDGGDNWDTDVKIIPNVICDELEAIVYKPSGGGKYLGVYYDNDSDGGQSQTWFTIIELESPAGGTDESVTLAKFKGAAGSTNANVLESASLAKSAGQSAAELGNVQETAALNKVDDVSPSNLISGEEAVALAKSKGVTGAAYASAPADVNLARNAGQSVAELGNIQETTALNKVNTIVPSTLISGEEVVSLSRIGIITPSEFSIFEEPVSLARVNALTVLEDFTATIQESVSLSRLLSAAAESQEVSIEEVNLAKVVAVSSASQLVAYSATSLNRINTIPANTLGTLYDLIQLNHIGGLSVLEEAQGQINESLTLNRVLSVLAETLEEGNENVSLAQVLGLIADSQEISEETVGLGASHGLTVLEQTQGQINESVMLTRLMGVVSSSQVETRGDLALNQLYTLGAESKHVAMTSVIFGSSYGLSTAVFPQISELVPLAKINTISLADNISAMEGINLLTSLLITVIPSSNYEISKIHENNVLYVRYRDKRYKVIFRDKRGGS